MAPKKQPQIDISTLPECKSINIMLYSLGKKERAQLLINKISTQGEKYISHVKKASVLDHAKQKGIYVDPESLTDKQKKDAKFMESISTQLTPQIFGKSVDSYLTAQNIKVRVEKKNELQKPQEQRQQSNRKFDFVYIFDDFPNEAPQFSALAQQKQNIDYIFILDPKISWANAPELPQEGEQQQGEPEDEQIVEYKKLLQKQKLTQEDAECEKKVHDQIKFIKECRKESNISSQFRNTVIEHIPISIDPYNEENSLNTVSPTFIERSNTLISEFSQFMQWKRQKETQPIIKEQKVQVQKKQGEQQKAEQQKPKVQAQPVRRKTEGSTPLQILMNFVQNISKKEDEKENQNSQEIDFNDYVFGQVKQNQTEPEENIENGNYLENNQWKNQGQRIRYEEILTFLKFPGVDRFQIPEIPQKSKDLRKLHRASLGQFLPENLDFDEFERKLDILTFEQSLKEVDEERTYNLSNRIYEEEHNKLSLVRTLYQALLFDESLMGLKYNENNDKLYLSLVYKNTPRHSHSKQWECNWKILPNFESWLKYFKQNDSNMQNNHYYDIDSEKVGNIEDKNIVYSTKGNGVIVNKVTSVANQSNNLLYGLAENMIFGLRNDVFYCENEKVKIVHKKCDEEQSTFITFKDQTILELKSSGDLIVRKPNQSVRLITPQGYTIIYQDKKPIILHPDGGISHPPKKYINKAGKGMDGNRLLDIASLKRKKDNCLVTKRDDGTVIVEEKGEKVKKWIKFPDGTQYLEENGLKIQKQNFPFFQIKGNTGALYYDEVKVQISKVQDSYKYHICFKNQSSVSCCKSLVNVYDSPDSIFECSIAEKYILKGWQNEEIKVFTCGKSQLKRNGKTLNPLQDEENYGEDETLPTEHIEPRLFLINNDNTGIQLFTQSQLSRNLELGQKCSNRKFYRNKRGSKEVLHFTQIQSTEREIKQKRIEDGISIDLDIFRKQESEAVNDKHHTVKVRSFIKYPELTAQDRQSITDVMNKNVEWKKKIEKDENEFGHKPLNDPLTMERFESKKKTIQYRKRLQKQINSEKFKKEAIELHEEQQENRRAELERLAKEQQYRRNNNKKKVYESSYVWKQPRYRDYDENQEYYNMQQDFYSTYFGTVEGKKALKQMPEWVFRPKERKQKKELDPEIISELNATNMNQTRKDQKDQEKSYDDQKNERYDTVQVNIQPNQILIKPSVFTQKEINDERFAFEEEKKAYDYHEIKRKDFDVYGRQRKSKLDVPSLMRTQPVSELNQKYLVTEAPVDKKVKISSMKDRLTNVASNMTEMRREGPHTNLIRTLDKRYDYGTLLEKRTMMVQADLNDKLQRDILINPIQANFGTVKEGSSYELKIQIKNEDVLSQRVSLKRPKSIFANVTMSSMGPIALGMTRKIIVTLNASAEITGKFDDEFDIVTKHQIYHIPIQAVVVNKNQFQNSKMSLLKTINEKKEVSNKKNQDSLPPIK